jgi:hypothetical protein
MTDILKYAEENNVPLDELATEMANRLGVDPERVLNAGVPLTDLVPALEGKLRERKNEEKELQEEEDFGAWERFIYKAREANTLTENVGQLINTYMPTGLPVWKDGGVHWASAEEVWGEQFIKGTPDARRQHLNRLREQRLEGSNPELAAAIERGDVGEFGGTAGVLGMLAGTLADPSTLLAPQSTIPKMIAADALLGGVWSVADQAAVQGTVDPRQTAVDAAISGAAGPLLITAGRGLSSAGRKVAKKIEDGAEMRRLDAQASELQDAILDEVASGVQLQPAITRARERTGLVDDDDYARVITKSTVKFVEPQSIEEARELVKVREGANLSSPQRQGLLSRIGDTAAADVIGTFDTAVQKISPKLGQLIQKYDMRLAQQQQQLRRDIQPWVKAFENLGNRGITGLARKAVGTRNEVQKRVALALGNGDFDDVRVILRREGGEEAVEAFEGVRKVLDKMHKEGMDAGLFTRGIDNYYPRVVKDLGRIERTLTGQEKSHIDRMLKEKADAMGVAVLPKAVKDEVYNQALRGRRADLAGGVGSSSKTRTIRELDADLLEAYEDPIVALNKYITDSSAKIAKRNMFGMDVASKKAAKGAEQASKAAARKTDYFPESLMDETDLDPAGFTENIGRLIRQIDEEEGLSTTDMGRLEDLLRARFDTGEQSVGRKTAFFRNIMQTTLLGNPLSAMVQLGDIGISAYKNGFVNTLRALANRTGNKVNVDTLGLDNVISESIDTFKGTARLLNQALSKGGFKMVDRLGKNTFIRANLLKAQQMVKSEKGLAKFRKLHGKQFGDELPDLIQDLKSGEITENVQLMLWNNLTEYQPISLSQMPIEYLKMKNGRIFYALKTFGVKQLDLLRRDIVQNFANGNKAQATKNLAAYLMIVPAANMTVQEARNMLLQREPLEPEDIPDAVAESLLRTFFLNEYMLNRYGKNGEIATMAVSTVTPPIQLWDDLGKTLLSGGRSILEGDLDEIDPAILKHTPLFGNLINNFLLGGREKFNERRRSN